MVCDSFGVGGAPDADVYGDLGSNTLGNCARAVGGIHAPNLAAMGLGEVGEIEGVPRAAGPGTAHGRLTEVSAGKDTTTGHWEIAGVELDRPFPTYPAGFPDRVIGPFERAVGREVLGNVPASGTEVISEFGEEHVRTGRPIVYTSADSVFQIACHEEIVSVETLYEWCRAARRILTGEDAVGRVIARPFTGEPGSFTRTPRRRDFSVPPPSPTLLDLCLDAGVSVFGVGKIADIFAARGFTADAYSNSDDDGVDRTLEFLSRSGPSLTFTNLVDFDSKFGHRNDPHGYAENVERFDRRIPELREGLGDGVMFVTGDHGCDPTTASTDHSREMTPLLVAGVPGGPYDVGDRSSFADLGATVGELLGVSTRGLHGESFAASVGFPASPALYL